MKLLAFISLLLLSVVCVLPQSKSTTTIRQIDRYVISIDKMTNRKEEPDLVVADVSDYDGQKAKWQVFKSSKDLETFRENTETYSIANNWRSNGRIVATVFTFFSPSGDWAQYVRHYFRADGSAAKITSELRTFYGDYIVIREMYFDQRGRSLRRSTKYLDLTTRKPKKPDQDLFADNPVLSRNEFYKKVSALPFPSLTRAKI